MKNLIGIVLMAAMGASAASGEPPAIALPTRADAEVVRLDYVGGFTAPRPEGVPRLAVLADGTVRMASAGRILTAKLDRKELLALIRLAVEEHRIFDFDRKRVEEEIRKKLGKDAPIVEDAADTVITVTLKTRRKQASFHALSWASRAYSDVGALQHLRAIERRLENLVQIVHAGGKDKVVPLLTAANDRLKKEYPTLAPLSVEDLVRTHPWRQGGMDLLFEHSHRSDEGVLRVRVDAPPSEPVRVSFERSPVR